MTSVLLVWRPSQTTIPTETFTLPLWRYHLDFPQRFFPPQSAFLAGVPTPLAIFWRLKIPVINLLCDDFQLFSRSLSDLSMIPSQHQIRRHEGLLSPPHRSSSRGPARPTVPLPSLSGKLPLNSFLILLFFSPRSTNPFHSRYRLSLHRPT